MMTNCSINWNLTVFCSDLITLVNLVLWFRQTATVAVNCEVTFGSAIAGHDRAVHFVLSSSWGQMGRDTLFEIQPPAQTYTTVRP
jgi:hypothetical protein